ncbi:MAG: LptA/OstA family protein [Victivallaceae bacterium]|nr:LptA/OstA family protein [Victivallaceae bacterium]
MRLPLLLVALIAGTGLFAAGDIDDLRGLELRNAKIPVNQGGRLQMMVYADHGVRQGMSIDGREVVLEVIRKKVDVDLIGDGWNTRYYKLGAPLSEVSDFWRNRIAYSDGVMITKRALLDQEHGRALGSYPVFFRSPEIDLDGVGFVADFDHRTMQVESDVKIVMREAKYDPRKLLSSSKIPPDYKYISAVCDTLLIDNARDQIMLIGNVEIKTDVSTAVPGGERTIDSDRLIIFLGDAGEEEDDNASSIGGSSSLSRLLAEGNVVMTDSSGHKAWSDTLLYDANHRTITLTSRDARKGANRAIDRNRQVRMAYDRYRLHGDRVELFLAEKSGEIDRCTCDGNVFIVASSKDTGADGSRLSASHAEFYNDRDFAVFSGKVHCVDSGSSMDCDRLDLFLAEAATGQSDSVVGFGGNKSLRKSVSIGNVRIVEPNHLLNTDKMVCNFRDAVAGEKQVSGMLHTGSSHLATVDCEGSVFACSLEKSSPPGTTGRAQASTLYCDKLHNDRDTNYTEAHGDVVMFDARHRLDCGHMIVYNKHIEPGAPVANPDDDINADPFALDTGENEVASRIMLDDDDQLDRIECEKDVAVTGLDGNDDLMRAEGDRGVYLSDERTFTITSQAPSYSRLRAQRRIQFCDYIIYYVDTELFRCGTTTKRTRYSEMDPLPVPPIQEKRRRK